MNRQNATHTHTLHTHTDTPSLNERTNKKKKSPVKTAPLKRKKKQVAKDNCA